MQNLYFIKGDQTHWYTSNYSIHDVIRTQFPGMITELMVCALDKWRLTIKTTGKQYFIVQHSQ